MIDLDILIPVYNEGANIVRVLDALKREVKTCFRVLICYDRDDDNTLEAIRSYGETPFPIVLVKNRGQGAHGAIVTGFAHGGSRAVIVMPADDDYNASIIDSMVREFDAGAEIVSASRFMPGGSMEGCPWLKALLVRISSFTLYWVARLPSHDATNGFRLFSRRVLDSVVLESTVGFSFSLELLVKSHRLGWRISEVPALWIERRVGKSRFQVLNWVPAYLRWFLYCFATTYGGRRVTLPETTFSERNPASTPN